MKWFKRFADVHWLAGAAPLEENVAAVLELWKSPPRTKPSPSSSSAK
jgi:hypothetical protein